MIRHHDDPIMLFKFAYKLSPTNRDQELELFSALGGGGGGHRLVLNPGPLLNDPIDVGFGLVWFGVLVCASP